MLAFDEEAHRYTWDGRVVPSVTQILQPLESWDMVDPKVLAAAQDFGTKAHKAIDYALKGILDWPSLDDSLRPYVDAALAWVSSTGSTVLESEARLFHHKKRYAGTADLVCDSRAKRSGSLCVVDWKTGAVPKTVGPQLAGYAQAYKAMHGKTPSRVCVQLKSDGTFRNLPQTERTDATIFQSCLNLHRWWENH